MKRIFKLSIILLALTCCVLSFDASGKTKQKAKTTATTSKWVELCRCYKEIWYINFDIKLQEDNDGYYIATVKTVPQKNYLETFRRENAILFNNSMYKKYTHRIVQWKVDVNGNRVKLMTSADYANNYLLSMDNYAETSNWSYPAYDSMIYGLYEAVRYAVKGY